MWWADEIIRGALKADGYPHAEALELYLHVLGAELIWLDRIQSLPQSVEVWPEGDLETCFALGSNARARYEAYINGLGENELHNQASYVNSAGQSFETEVGDILTHVALHGSYHRGQISSLLRGTGAKPAPSDYIAFVRGVAAATRDNATKD